jgi:hypothetical protein
MLRCPVVLSQQSCSSCALTLADAPLPACLPACLPAWVLQELTSDTWLTLLQLRAWLVYGSRPTELVVSRAALGTGHWALGTDCCDDACCVTWSITRYRTGHTIMSEQVIKTVTSYWRRK